MRTILKHAALGAVLVPSLLIAQGRGRPANVAGAADSAARVFADLPWRNIGPSRGGRSVAVSGVPGRALTYFAGYTGGGLWRTDDAGISWRNISDGQFRVGSIGAIAVAPSDHNVIYVGSGEHAIRGQSSSYGDGMYKSTDFGRTWTHVGLDATRQIAAVRVHPQDPNVVYVAAQGDRWRGSADRGVYRSRDGGTTWQLVLKGVNATSGASDLSMDPTNPRRVFAIVEAERGGLYRSDDAGRTWRLLSGDRLIQTRSWYYMKVVADPTNANVVWVLNAPILRSIDGGATFQTVQATHGDNHALWIDPTDPSRMINGNDGGASITLDGGTSWSSQDNQPTAQFYHVTVDDAFPYRLYSGQQDNSSVVIKSRSDNGSIGLRDWESSAGCESANIGVSPTQPRYVYGGCYQGILDEVDQETGLRRSIMAWPAMNLTERTDSTRYRFNWTAPILVSRHDPRVIYTGGNVLFRTTDRGTTWTPVSRDLSRNDPARQGWGGGPITNEGAGGEVYGTIIVIHESPTDAKTMYVGTDDGVLQRTTDGGGTWTDITPAAAGDGLVNEIEVSPHDPNTLYLAFRKDRVGDPTPHIFRSTDGGRSWTRLVEGLRPNEPVRVVREDPRTPGLLYAGTETGAYYSLDNGARWIPFSGLPKVPVTDLEARHGDLIASTEGRAFWILDDVSPLQQHAAAVASADLHLFTPRAAVLLQGGGGFGGAGAARVGANPPAGALLQYRLARADSTTRVTIEILDARNQIIRTYHSAARGTAAGSGAGAGAGASAGVGAGSGPRPSARSGINRFVWDLRYQGPATLPNVSLFGAPNGGPRVMPGSYTVRLTVGDIVRTQPIEVLRDPRLPSVAPQVLAQRDSIARLLSDRIGEMTASVQRLRDFRTQVGGIVTRTAEHEMADTISTAARGVTRRIEQLEPRLTTKAGNGQDIINYANGLNGQFGFLLGEVEEHPELTMQVRQRLIEVEALWRALSGELEAFEANELAAFNRLLERAKVPGVIITPRKAPAPIM